MSRLRDIPKVDDLLGSPPLAGLLGRHPRSLVVAAVRQVLEDARRRVRESTEADVDLSPAALLPLIEAAVVRSSRRSQGPHRPGVRQWLRHQRWSFQYPVIEVFVHGDDVGGVELLGGGAGALAEGLEV